MAGQCRKSYQYMALSGLKIVLNLKIMKIIKSCNEKSDEGYFFEVDFQYPEDLHDLHNDLPILSERMKIENLGKLAANLYDKTKYVVHIRNSKQALNHRLVLKKVHRMITFNQN